jgi:hypothetical protein
VVSKYFKVDGLTLWNPSNGVARLFVRSAEAMVEFAGCEVGMVDTGWDSYEVDPVAFGAFVEALAHGYLRSNHPVLRVLLEGLLATALVLIDRAGGTVAAMTEALADDPRHGSLVHLGIDPHGNAIRLRDLSARMADAMAA